MSISTLYIPAFSIETVILDKDSGLPLSNGIVTFYKDNQRATKKAVYQITGSEPNYTFTALPNPMTLSSIGTFEDDDGNPVVPYFYPYDGSEVDLYYVTVESEGHVEQFTREAVPYVIAGADAGTSGAQENLISNPQWVETFLQEDGPTVYSVTGSQVTPIAPGWDLVTGGTGTVTVQRLTNIGVSVDTSPSYSLSITTSGLGGEYELRQRWYESPKIAAGQNVSVFWLGSATSASADVTMYYTPSSGSSVELYNYTFGAGTGYLEASSNTPIISTSTAPSTTGYVDIRFVVSCTGTFAITSMQFAIVGDSTSILTYQQTTADRQLDYLFHYYKPLLSYKPTRSYLVGWDFPLNPAQFLGDTVTSSQFNIGANKSLYVWDQTIVFQSVDQGVGVTRSSDGDFVVTVASTCQFALVQYLGQKEARDLLNGTLSVNVLGKASASTVFTVSLWYTTAASLPAMSSNNSIVLSLDANGYPSSFNFVGTTWTEVPMIPSQKAQGTLTTALSDHAFEYFELTNGGEDTATFFAIVVGTESVASTDSVTLSSISLVPGQIATRPAAQTADEVLSNCQYYYEKSYEQSTIPTTVSAVNQLMIVQTAGVSGGNTVAWATNFGVTYKTLKRTSTPSFGVYSPTSGIFGLVSMNAVSSGSTTSTDINIGAWNQTGLGSKGVSYVPNTSANLVTTSGSSVSRASIAFQYVVDARLGLIS